MRILTPKLHTVQQATSVQPQLTGRTPFQQLVRPSSEVTPSLSAHLQSGRSSGQPLPDATRALFEPRFGFDFSQVRVHSGAQAAEMAHGLNAHAFTLGRDIVFGKGTYAPTTLQGKRLLAHELAHVVQQSGWRSGDAGDRFLQRRARAGAASNALGQQILVEALYRQQHPLLRYFYGFDQGTIISSNRWPGSFSKSRLLHAANRKRSGMAYENYRRVIKSGQAGGPSLTQFPDTDSFLNYGGNKCNIFVFDTLWNIGKRFSSSNGHYPDPRQVYRREVAGLYLVPYNTAQAGDLFVTEKHIGFLYYKIDPTWFKALEWWRRKPANPWGNYVRSIPKYQFFRVL